MTYRCKEMLFYRRGVILLLRGTTVLLEELPFGAISSPRGDVNVDRNESTMMVR